jgi:hypothetical protein
MKKKPMAVEQEDAGMQDAESLADMERFVVDNDDLLELESIIGRFNIFDALGIADVEIRHSNFLAFILDPAESHGLGQLFLKAVLMDLLKKAPAELRPLSPIELDGTDLRGVEVRREWEHIDLLITSKEPRFAVVVENKVGSHERPNQLRTYKRTMANRYPDIQPLYVYLTPNGDEPSEETWLPYSYLDIHGVLGRVRGTYHNAIGEEVLVFLNHYLSLIGAQFMNDPKIDDLCKRIYKNHRRALELIVERGRPASGVLAEGEGTLRDDPRWHVFYRRGDYIDFVPKAWLEWLPPLGLDNEEEPKSWFILRLHLFDGKLAFYAEVRRIADLAMRRKIVDLLIAKGSECGFKTGKSKRKVTDAYTRVA